MKVLRAIGDIKQNLMVKKVGFKGIKGRPAVGDTLEMICIYI